ncbi:MAG: hypothetical protein JHC95_10080 [Solirubrobacteraceae bacterium]|nr:hypothetical protein [Solirubrobacteraceae bacterium]
MPLRKDSRGSRAALALAGAIAALVIAPVAAQAAACNAATPTTKAFSKFGDTADYALVPGGDFEGGMEGWTLRGPVSVVNGNDGANVLPGKKSLRLAPGAVVITPEFCVDESHPHFRYMFKPNMFGASMSTIVQYRDASGSTLGLWLQAFSSTNTNLIPGSWKPSGFNPLALTIPLLQSGGKAATVRLMFISTTGFYSVDNVLVDPFRTR